MDNIFFSIIIPTYNRELYIRDTIMSVLGQTFTNFEILIIDNYSTDNTVAIVESFKDNRIFFHQNHQNFERCYSRNRGIALSKGEFILLLDSDDLFEPNHLQEWYEFIIQLNSPEKVFYVSEKKILLNDRIEVQYNTILKEHPVTYFFQNPILPGQVCIPSIIAKNYSFRNDLLIFEDAALWMELALDYPVLFNSISTFIYRNHDDNSVNVLKYNAYYLRLIAIRKILKEKKFAKYIIQKRFTLNACYMGVIRYHEYNSNRIKRFIWILKSLVLFPDFGFKNKLLLFLNVFPILSNLNYFKNRRLY
jgi:glycosyltransferase involved in cell wall biosynthesis